MNACNAENSFASRQCRDITICIIFYITSSCTSSHLKYLNSRVLHGKSILYFGPGYYIYYASEMVCGDAIDLLTLSVW